MGIAVGDEVAARVGVAVAVAVGVLVGGDVCVAVAVAVIVLVGVEVEVGVAVGSFCTSTMSCGRFAAVASRLARLRAVLPAVVSARL